MILIEIFEELEVCVVLGIPNDIINDIQQIYSTNICY